jgi:hypothetical protein
MLLGDWEGTKYPPFVLFKSNPAKSAITQAENNEKRNGFGVRLWREIRPLIDQFGCQIFGNKAAWWNSKMSIEFLEFHFANRETRTENVLLLWDDFSGHWTQEVVDYAASINVVLLKVPPRFTYVCQPADLAWIKPFKDRTRARWVEHLRDQLSTYASGAPQREHNKKATEDAILQIQTDHDQERAAALIAKVRQEHQDAPFALKAPNRRLIVEWISESWDGVTKATIIGGFIKAGLSTDARRPLSDDQGTNRDMTAVIDKLSQLDLTGDEVNSDEDIGGDSDGDELADSKNS